MRIVRSISEMQKISRQARREEARVGFVPTMGCLHAGHLSLIGLARETCERVVVSIFVNPAQFGPDEDLSRYPRPFEEDCRQCRESGVDILFSPDSTELYPNGHSTWVEETGLGGGLCGKSRPGHFRGVATVVVKLLNIVQPDVMVLGQKDAQQARILRQAIRDLNIPVEVIVGSTIREPDGLAMSSRNRYLAAPDRRRASSLHRGLAGMQALFARGNRSSVELKAEWRRIAGKEIDPDGLDYLEIVDPDTLQPMVDVRSGALALIAARVGGTRLIDNVTLG